MPSKKYKIWNKKSKQAAATSVLDNVREILRTPKDKSIVDHVRSIMLKLREFERIAKSD